MRIALTLLFTAALLPASAQAQVVIQDISTTFLSERENHRARMADNPQKWWSGDTQDRVARAYNEYDEPGYRMVPGNPLTVAPLFSMEEMLQADNPGYYPTSPDDLIPRGPGETGATAPVETAPATTSATNAASEAAPEADMAAQLSAGMISNAAERLNAAFGGNNELAQPFGATETLPEIAPPPTQDEADAVFLDPADALSDSETLSPDSTLALP